MPPITIVCASRYSVEDFFSKSALGRSLAQTYPWHPVRKKIYFENKKPLPVCYNDAVSSALDADEILVFVHEDVFILDFFWTQTISVGFEDFDVLGVAGNKRRVARQPSWNFIDDRWTWDYYSNLSGMVGHGREFPCPLSVYGPSGQRCKLLDGVLLASKKSILEENDVHFDEQFDFHFYDLDFCRQSELRNLRMGTIPLSILHESMGDFGNPLWKHNYEKYLMKWKD